MNLVLGLATMGSCLLLQSLIFARSIVYYGRHDHLVNSPSFAASLLVINGVMLLLVLGNLAQIAIWALLFQYMGEFPSFDDAFYHSAVNFATLGYGDLVMSEEHRLLGPIEAVNRVLMIGVSTAALTAAFQDAIKKTINTRNR
jgi:hypothetical protein